MRVGVKIKPYIMILKFLEYYKHESRYPCKSPQGCEMENQIFTKTNPQIISTIQKNLKESPRFARGLATYNSRGSLGDGPASAPPTRTRILRR